MMSITASANLSDAGQQQSAEDRIIREAKAGDNDARAKLIQGEQDIWFRYCLSMLGTEDVAREAAQETAMRFLNRLATFNGDSRLRTWGIGIALNVCRELRRRKPISPEVTAIEPLARDSDPAKSAEHAEDCQRLTGVLETLPDRQRETVVLRYLEQLSVRETAGLLGCAEGTVKATLNQAMTRLREKMGVTL